MAEAIFNYNGVNTVIQCNLEEKMKDIMNKFSNKIQKDLNSLNFIYDADKLKEDLKFKDLIRNSNINKINILVYSINEFNENKSIIKSTDIICPECKENCKIKLDNYTILLYDCKNNHETCINLIEEFEKNQNIDESKIKCDICKEKNKSEYSNTLSSICNSSNINLSPICKT